MNKELEYEVNNFANLLHKDCMNLMECLKKQGEDNKPILYLGKHYEKVILPYEEYKKMCKRLESIDNSTPSEALIEVDKILGYFGGDDVQIETMTLVKSNVLKIKQALLKAQEPKKYLKWEDLEFKEKTSRIEVKLNETLYILSYVKRQYLDFVYLINNDSQIRLNSANDIQLFNDLHLERVEE